MIYNRLTLLAVICMTMIQMTNAQGIEFEHGSWEEVKAKAQKENKPIFVDAYTTWCGPCKWMAKNAFAQEEVGLYFKKNFIAYKLDMEKGEGPAFAKRNKVNAYPTLLYFSSDGNMIHKGVGARDATELLALSDDALNPSKQLVNYVKRFDKGERSKDFLTEYLHVMADCGEDIEAPFKEYWGMLNPKEKLSAENLGMIANITGYFRNFDHELTQFFIDNKNAYKTVAAPEEFEAYVGTCYYFAMEKIAVTEDKNTEKALSERLNQAFPEYEKSFKKKLAYLKLALETPPNEDKVKKAYAKYLKVCQSANELNAAAWKVYEESDNSKELKQALKLIERSITITKGYNNTDTKARLLYKLKDYEGTKKAAQQSLELAQKEGIEDVSPIETFIETIDAKLK